MLRGCAMLFADLLRFFRCVMRFHDVRELSALCPCDVLMHGEKRGDELD
jgi:hypothetical protein